MAFHVCWREVSQVCCQYIKWSSSVGSIVSLVAWGGDGWVVGYGCAGVGGGAGVLGWGGGGCARVKNAGTLHGGRYEPIWTAMPCVKTWRQVSVNI